MYCCKNNSFQMRSFFLEKEKISNLSHLINVEGCDNISHNVDFHNSFQEWLLIADKRASDVRSEIEKYPPKQKVSAISICLAMQKLQRTHGRIRDFLSSQNGSTLLNYSSRQELYRKLRKTEEELSILFNH